MSRCPYAAHSGLYAAISPDLAYLSGKTVTACYRASCVAVKIIDCNCQTTKGIDLFADAFVVLSHLGAGVLHNVTLRW